MELWVKDKEKFKLFKEYPVCSYGNGSLGPKIKEGDGQAPEGFYYVTAGQLNPSSQYHLSFNLGFPNKYDRWHKRTGSALMVHGNCVSIGCFAMTNKQIEEIYTIVDAALRNGQSFFRVHIFPFKMTEQNMNSHIMPKETTLNSYSFWKKLKVFFLKKTKETYSTGSTQEVFWRNLKTGYDFFEINGNIPPSVSVKNGRYFFSLEK